MSRQLLAHSPSKSGRTDTVVDHLQSVAKRAVEFTSSFGAADEARLAGLLHDLGKYGELFQMRLRDQAEHIDHWSAGAWQSLSYRKQGLATALAIQGHHIGLQKAEKAALSILDPVKWDPRMHDGWRLSETNMESLLRQMTLDGLTPTVPNDSLYDYDGKNVSAMLDVRMLFSALVDADYLETEAHFNAVGNQKLYRPSGPLLEPERALSVLLAHIEKLQRESNAADLVNSLRADLLTACLDASAKHQGAFTLTAPTGSGKTLSMLAFALKHAVKHNLRRVVMIIPYLNIIDQTAKVYRTIFTPVFGADYIIEHHSLAGTRGEDEVQDVGEDRRHELSENWDAPIVVTTSVQMLESLFGNRPSACRKLHRLAHSVIMFDEVQTLQTALVIPTLAALSRLVERYQATTVFATATQPAFNHLGQHVKKYCACGWQPSEIVPSELKLFDHARRTTIEWPHLDTHTSWNELAGRLAGDECKQVLCVVNLKRHALLLFQKLRKILGSDANLFHLSTSMCPAHRKVVLDEIRLLLDGGRPCRLVSTQCVEAGVDVDFPVAFRAWGPLDSIVQVAGRCNRNGRLPQPGSVNVFVPEEDVYPPNGYGQAASVARVLYRGKPGGPNLDDPELYSEYYRQLYAIARPEDRSEALDDAIMRQDFAMVAELYRLIPDTTINVLVPYNANVHSELAEQVHCDGIKRDWILRARPYTIGVYRPRRDAAIVRWLEPVMADRTRATEDWFIYLKAEHYDPKTGLVPPESMDCLIG